MTGLNIQFRFPQKKVLVTGGTSGIGEAVVGAFSEAGADVVFTGRNQDRGRRVLAGIQDNSGSSLFVPGDLTDSAFCDALVQRTLDELEGLDIVVNCAGVIYHATASQTSNEQWQHTMNVNVNATFYVCRAALQPMQKSGGVIINIASDAGLSASSHLAAYNASKGAVIQLSRSMARDYGKYNIRVVPVCPGDVDTPMLRGEFDQLGITAQQGLQESSQGVPLQRVCTPGEVAHLVLYAASDSADFMSGYPIVLDAANRA